MPRRSHDKVVGKLLTVTGDHMLDRLLNELPTIAVIIAGVIGLSESDAAVWQEAAASVASLITWFTVRANIDGPVTLRKRNG